MNQRLTRRVPLVATVLALAALGCAANRPELTCPKLGGPAWTEVRSPHFLVETDLSEEVARQIALDGEAARAALLVALGAPADQGAAPVEIVMFERAADMAKTTGQPGLNGYFSPQLRGDVELQRVVVAWGGLDERSMLILQHELTHEIVARRTARLPWWLSEGLADTFSTVRVDGGQMIVGEPPLRTDFWEQSYSVRDISLRVPKTFLSVSDAPSLDEILGAKGPPVGGVDRTLEYYTAAWKLVHVLRGDTNPSWAPRFASMMKALMNGTGGFEAFARAYKGVAFSDITSAYQASLVDHREYPSTVEYQAPPAPAVTARKLSDGEVHALWARLLTQFEGTSRSASAELVKGFADDPGSVELRYARASIDMEGGKPPLAEDIRVLREKQPDSPRYLLLDLARVIRSLPSGATLSEGQQTEILALSTRLSEIALSPAQRGWSIVGLILAGRHQAAIALGEKTVQTDPSCGPCFSGYAAALLAADRPKEALDAAQNALALLHESQTGAQLKAVQELIARGEAALKKASPAP